MAKSLRSKWKRKMKAIKRVRYGEKVSSAALVLLRQVVWSGPRRLQAPAHSTQESGLPTEIWDLPPF